MNLLLTACKDIKNLLNQTLLFGNIRNNKFFLNDGTGELTQIYSFLFKLV